MRTYILILLLSFPVVILSQEITPVRAVRKHLISDHNAQLTPNLSKDGVKNSNNEYVKKIEKDSILSSNEISWTLLDMNSPYVQNKVAWRCYTGDIYVAKNDSLALALWTKAATKGYASAQVQLGLLYRYGDIVTQDNKVAVNWFTKAANHGKKEAQYSIGVMYYYGEGVDKDLEVAVSWFYLAAKQGDQDAINALKTLGLEHLLTSPDSNGTTELPTEDTNKETEQ